MSPQRSASWRMRRMLRLRTWWRASSLDTSSAASPRTPAYSSRRSISWRSRAGFAGWPVAGPYVGTANPLRGGTGRRAAVDHHIRAGAPYKADGHLVVKVRGLVLADQPPVPAALQGTNPIPDFQAIVSCQSIGASNSASIANVITGAFTASRDGNSKIHARVSLPCPCIALIVFVTGPGIWLAATGG